MDKNKQKKILIELLNENLELKPFNVAFLREITDMYELGEISYGRMVEMLNEIAMNWFKKQQQITESWDDIEQEYLKDEYPVFGGPFTDALKPFEWLSKHYYSPKRKL